MPPPTNSPGTPEPDPALRARVARYAAENRNPGLVGERRPFDIYYDATGRPLTRHRHASFLPEPHFGETRGEALARGGRRVLGNVLKLGGGMAADSARVLQILQTSTINDLARISPLGGAMNHAMNQVVAESQYGLFAPHDRRQNYGGHGMNNISQIGELIALSGAMNHSGGNIAPHSML
jgi:hypothetical protein